MKTVTTAFQKAWASNDKKAARRIIYYRRYFNTDTNAFQLEASSNTLDEDEIKSISNVSWKLDTVTLNLFSASNVVIALNNGDNKWSEFNEKGVWAPDSVAKIGYIPFLSKFVVQAGYDTPAGLEYVDIFTGYIGDDMVADTDSSTIDIPIIDGKILLEQADAEEVSTLSAVSAMVGTVDGLNDDFYSSATGVGRIIVFLDGVEQVLGTDYVVDSLNDPDLPAHVTFTIAPPLFSVVTHQVYTWFVDKKIDELVALLCDEAGVTDRVIDPTVFPSGVINQELIDSQPEFDLGVYTNTESKPDNGGLVQVALIPTYTDVDNSAPTPTGSLDNNGKAIAQSFTVTQDEFITVVELDGAANSSAVFNHTGKIMADDLGEPGEVLTTFFFQTTSTASGLKSAVLQDSVKVVAGQRIWIYLDGQASSGAAFNWNRAGDDYSGGTAWRSDTGLQVFDFIFKAKARHYYTTGTRKWRTANVDGTASLKAWGRVRIGAAVPTGLTLTFTTETSTDGISFDPEVDLPANGQIQSTVKRYLRVSAYFTATNIETPKLDEMIVQFTTTDIVIALANFTSLSCLQAISELARFASSEYGFNASGRFFFRNRVINDIPVMELNQHNALVRVVNSVSGVRGVKNNIQVSYGSFVKKITPVTQGERTPHSMDKYGSSILNISGSQLVIGEDVDVATGTALLYFNLLKEPKKTMRMISKMVPQLELGDPIKATFLDNTPNPTWFWGDNTRQWNQSEIDYYGEKQQFFFQLVAKVVGITYNLDEWTSDLEVQEI